MALNPGAWVDDIKEALQRAKTVDGYDYSAKERYHEPAPDSTDIEAFRTVVRSRRSVRKFTSRPIPRDVLDECLDLAMLAPSSCNLQPWEFHVVQTAGLKQALVAQCMNQSAARTAAELIVVVARTRHWDTVARLNVEQWPTPEIPRHWKQFYQRGVPLTYWQGPLGLAGRAKRAAATVVGWFQPIARGPFSQEDMRVWAVKSVALAAENLMLALRAHGFDSCPMEGMDAHRIHTLLALPDDAEIVMVIGAGERARDGVYFPRVAFDRRHFVHYR